MRDQLHRAHPADLELRGDGRTVVGLAVPFDTPAPIRDATGSYAEVFRVGAFARTIAERGDKVKFLAQHDRRSLPLGRALVLREDTAGLYAEFRVSQTQAGDEALELIRDGALDALSIGFRPIRDRWSATRSEVERLEVRLDEVSAVAFPAYEGALIASVRTSGPTIPHEVAARRLALIERL
ncbi:MAG: HK97 family phage prohead protease [Acidimicrobiales bacterium]|nr:HK97 family phage prohead protease [Acidimicrobiales bacterium]